MASACHFCSLAVFPLLMIPLGQSLPFSTVLPVFAKHMLSAYFCPLLYVQLSVGYPQLAFCTLSPTRHELFIESEYLEAK